MQQRLSKWMEWQLSEYRDQNGDVPDFSAREHVSALITSTRQLFRIELDFYRARLNYSQKLIRRAGLFGAIAMSFLFAAIVALVLGILLIVAAFLSPELATMTVTAVFLLIALLFGWLARLNIQKLKFPEFSEDRTDEPE